MALSGISFKNDKYKKARGGTSRLLDIYCAACKSHLCVYQKDGPGLLKRMYLDRIYKSRYEGLNNKALSDIPELLCLRCHAHIGTPIIYEKEKRLAYRLIIGSYTKKTMKVQ